LSHLVRKSQVRQLLSPDCWRGSHALRGRVPRRMYVHLEVTRRSGRSICPEATPRPLTPSRSQGSLESPLRGPCRCVCRRRCPGVAPEGVALTIPRLDDGTFPHPRG